MTPLSYADCQSIKYEKQLTIKMTQSMLEHIQTVAEKSNKTISDATRWLIFLGISSLDDR